MRYKVLALGLSALAVLGIGIILSPLRDREPDPVQAASLAESEKAIVNVEDLMAKPDQHKGRVSVAGIVSGVSVEQKTLALIDRREFSECGVTTCAKLTLPIQWLGPMPDVEDEIILRGEIQNMNEKLIFVAKSLKKLSSLLPKDGNE